MTINSIQIRNFRNIEYTAIDLAPANFLVGMNGAGKSSILNALQMALYGWCQHTDRRGAGYRDLIGPYGDESEIAVTVDDYYQITVILGAKRGYEVVDLTTGEILADIASPAALLAKLGIDATSALVSMFPSQIVHSAEFSGLLSAYLADALTAGKLADAVPANRAEFVLTLARKRGIDLTTPSGYDALGDAAYDMRRDIARDLKHAEATVKEIGFLKPVKGDTRTLTVGDLPSLQRALDRCNAEIQELHVQKGRASMPTPDEPEDPAPLRARRAELIALTDAVECYHRADAAHRQAVERHQQASADLTAAEKAADIGSMCPTCRRKLTPKMREELNAAGIAAVAAAREKYEAADAALATASIARDKAERACDGIEDTGPLYEELADLKIAIERAEAPRVVYDGPSLEEVEAAIAEKCKRRDTLAEWISGVRKHQELADAKAAVDAMTKEHEALDWVVKAFRDGVITKKILADAAAPLCAALDGLIEIVPDGKTFAVLYDGRPLALASEGQRARIAYMLALHFAASGAPVFLDDINDLDPVNRAELLGRLVMQSSGTVVVAGTPLAGDLDGLVRDVAPVQVVRVADGYAAIVAAKEVAA